MALEFDFGVTGVGTGLGPGSGAGQVADRRFEGDVHLFHTPDGGEIEITNGLVTRDAGLRTSAYLSLFGGNERDDGSAAKDSAQWWGNLLEDEPARALRSETQNLLVALPAVTSNLRRIEDAVKRDLAWMAAELAEAIEATATIPGLNRVQIDIAITIGEEVVRLRFSEYWGRS